MAKGAALHLGDISGHWLDAAGVYGCILVGSFGSRMKTQEQVRTEQQQKALEVYCRKVAKFLNDRGLLMQAIVLNRVIKVRWTQDAVKDGIWRPLQIALTEKVSSTEPSPAQYPLIYEQMCAVLAEMSEDIPPPWPSRFGD